MAFQELTYRARLSATVMPSRSAFHSTKYSCVRVGWEIERVDGRDLTSAVDSPPLRIRSRDRQNANPLLRRVTRSRCDIAALYIRRAAEHVSMSSTFRYVADASSAIRHESIPNRPHARCIH